MHAITISNLGRYLNVHGARTMKGFAAQYEDGFSENKLNIELFSSTGKIQNCFPCRSQSKNYLSIYSIIRITLDSPEVNSEVAVSK